jgi:tRNA-specific 2-thiouridylase
MTRTAVAVSGGVDSSVAAALLLEAGRDVFGVTMRLGLAEITGRQCCGEEEVLLARRVCDLLGIQHVVVDMAEEFSSEVVEPFVDAYAAGLTPNPCVRCNERVKLGAFAERARRLGADEIATGHYARTVSEDGTVWLERAADAAKDQSYFLYRVGPDVLGRLVFPLGDTTKSEVRARAHALGLPTAARRESQEVCFTDDHAALVAHTHPEALSPGPMLDAAGRTLGTHRGLARYTVGQRKGLGLGGPEGPFVVIALDPGRNALVVGPPAALDRAGVTLSDAIWRLDGPATVGAQIRYRATPLEATATPSGPARLDVRFSAPARGLAPGQSVVLYQGDRVVGGGILTASADVSA